jgi:hypothetical protein
MTPDTFLSLRNVSQCEMSIERGEQRKTKNEHRKTNIDQPVKKRLDLSTAVEMTPDTFLSLRNVSQCEMSIERGEQRKTKNEDRKTNIEKRTSTNQLKKD